jgi:hypothetical protein
MVVQMCCRRFSMTPYWPLSTCKNLISWTCANSATSIIVKDIFRIFCWELILLFCSLCKYHAINMKINFRILFVTLYYVSGNVVVS